MMKVYKSKLQSAHTSDFIKLFSHDFKKSLGIRKKTKSILGKLSERGVNVEKSRSGKNWEQIMATHVHNGNKLFPEPEGTEKTLLTVPKTF